MKIDTELFSMSYERGRKFCWIRGRILVLNWGLPRKIRQPIGYQPTDSQSGTTLNCVQLLVKRSSLHLRLGPVYIIRALSLKCRNVKFYLKTLEITLCQLRPASPTVAYVAPPIAARRRSGHRPTDPCTRRPTTASLPLWINDGARSRRSTWKIRRFSWLREQQNPDRCNFDTIPFRLFRLDGTRSTLNTSSVKMSEILWNTVGNEREALKKGRQWNSETWISS